MTVRREAAPESGVSEDAEVIHLQQFSPVSDVAVRTRAGQRDAEAKVAPHVLSDGSAGFLYDVAFDVESAPTGRDVDISLEINAPGIQGRSERETELTFPIVGPSDVATMWVLLPRDMPYERFEPVGFDPSQPGSVEVVEPTYRFEMADGSVFGWMLVAPREEFTYKCRWTWKSDARACQTANRCTG